MPTTPPEVNASEAKATDVSVVHPEMVCNLVHYGGLDLAPEGCGRAEVALERSGEDRDVIRKGGEVVRATGKWSSPVEPVERPPSRCDVELAEERRRRLVLDHDRDVREVARELLGNVVERLGDEALELDALHRRHSVDATRRVSTGLRLRPAIG